MACDNPLVEASLIEAEQGAVITLVNWAQNIEAVGAPPSLRVAGWGSGQRSPPASRLKAGTSTSSAQDCSLGLVHAFLYNL